MLLWIRHFLSTNRYTAAYFIRLAHVWKFGRDIIPTPEDEHALLCGEQLPPYLVDFVRHLQEVNRETPQVPPTPPPS